MFLKHIEDDHIPETETDRRDGFSAIGREQGVVTSASTDRPVGFLRMIHLKYRAGVVGKSTDDAHIKLDITAESGNLDQFREFLKGGDAFTIRE